MIDPRTLFDRVDERLTGWMARHGLALLRISMGVVFFWFGFLKFFPGLSPAEGLAERTIRILTFDLVPARTALVILAAWECLIGLGFLLNRFLRAALLLLWLQMIGAVAPVVLLPEAVFTRFPYALTLEGQYIIKNTILISAGIVIGGTLRRVRKERT